MTAPVLDSAWQDLTSRGERQRMQPLRVGLISLDGVVAARPRYGRSDTGGQVRFVLAIARVLVDAGHTVDVITRRTSHRSRSEVDISRRVRLVRASVGPAQLLPKEQVAAHVVDSAHRLELDDYDVLWSHYWTSGQAVAAAVGDALPHIFTPYSVSQVKARRMQGVPGSVPKARGSAEKTAMGSASLVTALTETQARELRQFNPGMEVLTVRPPVEETFQSGYATKHGESGPIGALGRIDPSKGFDLLIEAYARRRSELPHLEIALCDNWTSGERKYIAQLAGVAKSLDIDIRSVLVPRVKEADLKAWLQAHSVIAVPSRHESLGLVALEALAAGVPLVLTEAGELAAELEMAWPFAARPENADLFSSALYELTHRLDMHREELDRLSRRVRLLFSYRLLAEQASSAVAAALRVPVRRPTSETS